MEIVKFREEYTKPLFTYWNRLGENIPYFFSVTAERWLECMIDDRLDESKKFRSQEIYLAFDEDQVIGFIQYGQPAFSWDEYGKKYENPQIGVIRHFYFDEGQIQAANRLYAKSSPFMDQYAIQHAFYHILGMSCNAHHGKLHQQFAHIERFLLEIGYRVEHENIYYTFEVGKGVVAQRNDLFLVPKPANKPDQQEYDIFLHDKYIGGIHIRFLDALTGAETTDVVYLSWIGIDIAFRGQGWGTQAIKLLVANLRKSGYHLLHTDTASTNTNAQYFYERIGFLHQGKTRSYIKIVS